MTPPDTLDGPPATAAPVPTGAWALLVAAVLASLLLVPLGALLAVGGVVRERRARRELLAAAFTAVALLDLVVLAAVGLSLVVGAPSAPR
jgi:hypothetical protein